MVDIEYLGSDHVERDSKTSADRAAEAAIEQMGEESGSDFSISIQRQTGTGKEPMQFVAKYPLDLYTIDELKQILQRDFGGGNYRFMVYDGRGKLKENKLYSIAAKEEKKDKEADRLESILMQVVESQEKMMQAMAIMHQSAKPTESRADFLEEMRVMKELFGGGGGVVERDSLGDMTKMIGVIGKINELTSAGQSGPSGDSADTFSALMESALPVIKEITKVDRVGEKAGQIKRASANKVEKGGDVMLETVAEALLEAVNEGKNAAVVAGELIDEVPKMFMGRLKKALKDRQLIEKIAACEPELIEHEKWMIEVFEKCKDLTGV